MTDINNLISAASPHIPFRSENAAQQFLSQHTVSDQAALVSALYIGRDHLHDDKIQPNYVPNGIVFDRNFHTYGVTSGRWLIEPTDFARILYEKNSQLTDYFTAFQRCAKASRYVLAKF
ncbi:hypothetical protein B1H58_17670 [Pantoea alhagi]|uniref:Uncharacterized protein n=1 Tax=Pantoea alhagi TaxID=1891675 RepID=A0A1W6B9J5_9GAMM|nr:hypothetical protein [Pantoea alhagi]ARJ43693.1 hypothetical protein B1H58_17670 [Pantoea alhagi]